MTFLAREPLRTRAYWDQRAAGSNWSAVMWPNAAFSACVDQRQKQTVLALLPDMTGKRILDVGCGTGRMSFFLADHGALVTGTDFSERMIARANEDLRRRGSTGVRFLHASVQDLQPLGDHFDCVLSVACLCFSESREAFRRHIAIVCALVDTSGSILLIEPMHRRWPLRRVRPLPPQDWIAEFAAHGFAPVGQDRMIFFPLKFVCGLLPVPGAITRVLFVLGERLLRLPLVGRLMPDYQVLLLRRP